MGGASMDKSTFLAALTRTVGALHRAEVPFALAGGAALYARGGPHSHDDIDLLVEPAHAERAAIVLAEAGMTRSQPPEDWLLKVFDGEVLVDLIHHLGQIPVSAETLSGAEPIQVGSVITRVITATELMVQKLTVLDCHRCDFAEPLLAARVLREQVDWPQVRRRLRPSPFADAFWQLLCGMSIVDEEHTVPCQPPNHLVAVVRRRLAEDPEIGELGIGVEIDDVAVRLSGSVDGAQRLALIESAVRRIVGTRKIVNEIEVVQLLEPAERVSG